jgi:hypothetical protein
VDDPINAKSLADLRRHEAMIVERINARPNGGHLFLLDPLQTLQLIGVRLSPRAAQEIARLEPGSRSPDRLAFANLVRTQADQRIAVTLSGLFRPEQQA